MKYKVTVTESQTVITNHYDNNGLCYQNYGPTMNGVPKTYSIETDDAVEYLESIGCVNITYYSMKPKHV